MPTSKSTSIYFFMLLCMYSFIQWTSFWAQKMRKLLCWALMALPSRNSGSLGEWYKHKTHSIQLKCHAFCYTRHHGNSVGRLENSASGRVHSGPSLSPPHLLSSLLAGLNALILPNTRNLQGTPESCRTLDSFLVARGQVRHMHISCQGGSGVQGCRPGCKIASQHPSLSAGEMLPVATPELVDLIHVSRRDKRL